jgi:hypothetical protein
VSVLNTRQVFWQRLSTGFSQRGAGRWGCQGFHPLFQLREITSPGFFKELALFGVEGFRLHPEANPLVVGQLQLQRLNQQRSVLEGLCGANGFIGEANEFGGSSGGVIERA